MKARRFSNVLRTAALASFLVPTLAWVFTGAHAGWTKTQVVEIKNDEITGIAYPVLKKAFIPGVEIPVGGAALGLGLVAISFLPVVRRTPAAPL